MENQSRLPHEHASEAGAPGASAPGDQGYDGGYTVGDVGGSANALEFSDPFGRPDTMAEAGPNGALTGEGAQMGVAPGDTIDVPDAVPGESPAVEQAWDRQRGMGGEAPSG